MDEKKIPDSKQKNTTNNKKTEQNSKKTTSSKKPVSNTKKTTSTGKKSTSNTKKTSSNTKKPSNTNKRPATNAKKSTSITKKTSTFLRILTKNKKAAPKKKKVTLKQRFSSKRMKGILIASGIVLLIAILFGIFILYSMFTDYRPDDQISLTIDNNLTNQAAANDTFSVTTFNIGYCGLDSNQDFFMDGGTKSRSSSKEKTRANLESNIFNLEKIDSDFLLIQEIDINSTRSFNINQYENLKENLTKYGSTFGKNYDVSYVPVPIYKPMGAVESGIGTFSKYNISSSTRYNLPVDDSWPNSLFLLDRCISENVIELDNGKRLILVNLHLSAYDDGTVRAEQVNMLKNYMQSTYNEDTYVILGGDWNHYLIDNPENVDNWVAELPSDFLPTNWQWAVDQSTPTVRDLSTEYLEGITYTTVIDGFLVSPNIEIISVEGKNLYFENSDHNPVTLEFELR